MDNTVYVCSDEYTGKPGKTPTRTQGNAKRAIELSKKWSSKYRYNKTDRYLNS